MSFAIAPAFADSTVFSIPKLMMSTYHQRSVRVVPRNDPIQVYLFGDISSNFFVTQPLQITIEQDEDGSYIASDDIFLVYGDGGDRSGAINDYVVSLIEFYRLLEKDSATNPFDKKHFEYLRTYVQPKSLRVYDAIQTNRD